jgi:hypothetical protein
MALFLTLFLLLASGTTFAGDLVISGTLTHEFLVAPGAGSAGTVVVENPNDEAQEVAVTQTDYSFGAEGTTQFGVPGSVPRSNAGWIEVSPHRFLIPPHQSATVNYAIRVPVNPALAGTYWSVLMFEPVDSDSPGAPAARPPLLGLNQVLRYAVQIVTQLGDTGTRQLTFEKVQLPGPGQKALVVDARNTGERWLRGALWVELYRRDGSLAGRFEAAQQRMYPGTSVRYHVDLAGIEPGSYKAVIAVDCGGDDVFGASLSVALLPR